MQPRRPGSVLRPSAAMAEAGRQQPAGEGTDGAAAAATDAQPAAADSQQQMQDGGRKSKQPIKYVPPKPASGNPNFGPRKAWPGGSITVKHPKNPLPPGVHRWKGGGPQTQAPSQAGHRGPPAYTSQRFGSRLRTASGSHGGGIDMHSAIALQLQSAPSGRGGAPPCSGPGASAGTLNGRSGQNGHYGGSSEAPEPGEVPAGLRRHALERVAGKHATASAGAHAAAAGRGSGLAQLYKQQGGGSLLEAMAQRRNSGNSPARGSPGPHGSGVGGVGGGGNPVLRRPSGGSPAFKEGFSIANKLLAALEQNAVQLAASHAAVIAAHPAGEEGNSLRLGFTSRIRSQQQEFANDEAYVAELNEYLAAASGRAGAGAGAEATPAATAKGSFSFGIDSAGFGSSLSVGTPHDAWAASDLRRGVGVLRHGSRRVEVVGGTHGERQVSPGGDIGGGGGGVKGSMGSSFKGFKRKAQWQADSVAASSRKVVAMGGGGGSGFGSSGGGSSSFASKYNKPAAAKSQQHTFKKQPAAAAQQAPASVEQKLGMSLDAIAGKPGTSKPVQQSAVRAAAGGGGGAAAAAAAAGGAAADGGSRKHKPIAWGA